MKYKFILMFFIFSFFPTFIWADAIAGGATTPATLPYAGTVSSSNFTYTPISGAPSTTGAILSVAINTSCQSIIGGRDGNFSTAYAAFVSPTGNTTEITPLPSDGNIFAVDINYSSFGIIGGETFSPANGYLALVSPNAVATPVTGDEPPVAVNDVAINNSRMGIAGGTGGYLVTITPDGTATQVTGDVPFGYIYSVDITDASTSSENPIVPSSFGPGNSFSNALFNVSQVQSNHLLFFGKEPQRGSSSVSNEVGLLTDAGHRIRGKKRHSKSSSTCCPTYSLWLSPFGSYYNQNSMESFPEITNWIGGFVLGVDYLGCRNSIYGISGAYAYNDVDYSSSSSDAYFNQGFLSIYGAWCFNNIYAQIALWGGYYKLHNDRSTLGSITSTSDTSGWLLSPHLELYTSYCRYGCVTIDPFIMLDWANNWQDDVKETGSSGLNINIGSQYMSLLRTELGLRFYETLCYKCGTLLLEQKGSYINKTPFNVSSTTAFFTGSISTFGISVFTSDTLHLGAVQLASKFLPCNPCYPYFGLGYQGEFGSGTQLHFIYLEIGKDF